MYQSVDLYFSIQKDINKFVVEFYDFLYSFLNGQDLNLRQRSI